MQSVRRQRGKDLNARKGHRGKNTEPGGSDPDFSAFSRPKSPWGRSRPPAHKPVLFFSTVQSRNKVSCTLYSNSRAEKETAHGDPKGAVQPAKEWSPPCG